MARTRQDSRLSIRLSAAQKSRIEIAAGLLGQSVNSFSVSTLVREAKNVIEQHGALCLSDRDRDAFLAALDKPPNPNPRLRKAAHSHAKQVAR